MCQCTSRCAKRAPAFLPDDRAHIFTVLHGPVANFAIFDSIFISTREVHHNHIRTASVAKIFAVVVLRLINTLMALVAAVTIASITTVVVVVVLFAATV